MPELICRKFYAEHEGGTKFYEITEITLSPHGGETRNLAMSIFRWGKIGATGQIDVIEGTSQYISGLVSEKHNAKTKNGYSFRSPQVKAWRTKEFFIADLEPKGLKFDVNINRFLNTVFKGARGEITAIYVDEADKVLNAARSKLVGVIKGKSTGPIFVDEMWGTW